MMGTAENPYHTYLHILQNASCQEPSRGGGGGCAFPCTPPLRSTPGFGIFSVLELQQNYEQGYVSTSLNLQTGLITLLRYMYYYS